MTVDGGVSTRAVACSGAVSCRVRARMITPSRVASSPPRGHTTGHVALWQPEERVLAVGDAMSDDDVGWVNTALDGGR